ncbi:unnamed protein product [Mytilus coruscus]|uniref:Ubiquitin-like protease family profile domain-containing protein n=1 Tax=Mytilus coruscus TaxID=42192 RepID=A0A6J8EBX6_MYTCO|nr:unnamed protein product [Mytilus coruscus]
MEQTPLQQTQDTGWCDFFSTFHNPYNGFVESKEQLEELKWHYEVETKSYFVSVKTSSTFGNTDIGSKQHKIQWREKNNLHMPDNPYIVLQTERFECHHGPDRNKAKKVKAQNTQVHFIGPDNGPEILRHQTGFTVDEGILILEKDPLKTSETLEKEMQELIKFLKESGTLVSKARKIQWMDGFMTDLTVTEIDKQKVENKVAKIWDEDVANKYFIAKVMDAYLTYIAQTEMDKGNIKIRHQLVSSTNNIINGKYVPGRHEKNKLIPYDFVIGAYHQRGGHWDLLIVEPSKGKVVFLNPLGESPNQKRTVLLNWRKYIGQMLLLHPENGYKNWTLEVPDHSKQLDGSSCGIFCLLFAEKYLAGQSLLGITQEEVKNKRVTIAHTLMMFEGHMVGCCPCCRFRTNADEEQLIQCKICKNLFHRKTHCVGEAFAAGTSNEDFVCEIDRTVEKNELFYVDSSGGGENAQREPQTFDYNRNEEQETFQF